ncbi:MAG: hypothetical protein ACQKBY_02310 [Verrucomicrobiales bacterium]
MIFVLHLFSATSRKKVFSIIAPSNSNQEPSAPHELLVQDVLFGAALDASGQESDFLLTQSFLSTSRLIAFFDKGFIAKKND